MFSAEGMVLFGKQALFQLCLRNMEKYSTTF